MHEGKIWLGRRDRKEFCINQRKKVSNALILALLDFDKLFKVKYDACGIGIGVVLS